MIMLLQVFNVFADQNKCAKNISGYKIVNQSTYSFYIEKEKACFFAFYTPNPDPNPMIDTKGSGNLDDSLWYGYYKANNPNVIYEFPKPSDANWGSVCSIDAVSFIPMHGGNKRDVTVIGACDKNPINYTVPFVFVWDGNKYILDQEVYTGIYGFISLTIADVRNYIKSPETQYKYLNERYNPGS